MIEGYVLILVAVFGLLVSIVIVSVLILAVCNGKKEKAEAGGYQIAAVSEIGRRQEQQDAYWFSGMEENIQQTSINPGRNRSQSVNQAVIHSEDDCIAVVADGMGGMKNGGEISRIIADGMKDSFFCPGRPEQPVKFLQNALWKVNERVNDFLDRKRNENGGSTIVAAYVRENSLYYLSVGDSRIYHIHQEEIHKLNMEHNFGYDLDDMAARGIISEEEAKQNRQRAALTSYVGMGEISRVDGNTEPIPLKKGDQILLMTDGVFGTVTEQEIFDCVCKTDCRRTVLELRRAVERQGKPKQDNYSVIAIRIL